MADMEVQIEINASSKEAQKSIDNLSKSFKGLSLVAEDAAENITDVEKAASPQVGVFTRAGIAVSAFGNALDDLERKTKKFGRELTQNVSLPILALAGLSLKNLYDEGAKLGSSGPARDFALLIQTIGDNFKALTLTLAQDFQPTITVILTMINNTILYFKGLDSETRKMIVTFGLIASAIGPVVLAISGLMSVVSQLAIVAGPLISAFKAIFAVLASPAALIATLVGTLVGLGNVFLKLKEAGVSTAEALQLSFNLFVTGFNNYVVGNILDGVSAIIKGLGYLSGFFSEDIKKSLDSAVSYIDGFSTQLEQKFAANKDNIDTKLSSIGSSTADAFTLGFSTKIEEFKSKLGTMFDSASSTTLNQLTKEEQEAQDKAQKDLDDKLKARTEQIKNTISNGLAGAFGEIASGAKSAEQAFGDFARSTISNLVQMIAQAMIFKALFPDGGVGLNSAASGLAGVGMATGGYVSGPGSSTSDSIAARLSNGEYVMDAKTVRAYGVDFFRGLQAFGRNGVGSKKTGSHIPGYADGGFVTSPSTTPQVVIQNTGAPKEVESSSFDPSTAVTTVILSDLQKNGPVSKGLQSAFGFRKQGRV